MSDYNEILIDIQRRLDEIEREAFRVRGPLPPNPIPGDMSDRITAIEAMLATIRVLADDPQAVQLGSGSQDVEAIATDIEWGKPDATTYAAGVTGDSTTITLQPCEEDGTSYANADTAKVYIRTDRASVNLDRIAWLAAAAAAGETPAVVGTILSFVRFPWDTTTDSAVGVLVGLGGPDDKVAVSTADDLPGFLRFTAGDSQAHHKLIGDSEPTAVGAATGEWLQAVKVDAGNEEQLKIEHVGPGASCCCCSAYLLDGIDLDAKGHVRQFRYNNNCADSTWTGIV